MQADIKLWPFKCVAGQGDKPMIIVNAQGEARRRPTKTHKTHCIHLYSIFDVIFDIFYRGHLHISAGVGICGFVFQFSTRDGHADMAEPFLSRGLRRRSSTLKRSLP